MMDRKIVEYLVMGKPHRWIKEQLGVGAGRLAKVQALAQAHGYLSGQAMPAYPQALFADRTDRRSEQQAQIRELARLKFIDEHAIALFLGPPGVGKTHIALAIGTAAAHRGHRVFFSSAKRLIEQITLAKLDNTLDQLFKRVLACKLWIIDDFGVVSMKRDIAEEVFDLLDRRKYSSALMLTSNRDPAEWGEVFPNAILANATIDRLFEHAHTLIPSSSKARATGSKVESRPPEIDGARPTT